MKLTPAHFILCSSILWVSGAVGADTLKLDCGPVKAKSLIEVCKKYTSNEGQVQCFKAGKDAKFDPCALGFCDTYPSEHNCTQCLLAVRNKKYTVTELEQCNQFTSEPVATSCMDVAGSPIPES